MKQCEYNQPILSSTTHSIYLFQDTAALPSPLTLLCLSSYREEGKLLAMRQLIAEGLRPPVLVFLQSKDRAKELFHELVYDGINVDVIHAERTQEQRDAVIRKFRAGEIWVLICTDLMARGIDFKGVNMVINYDLPQSAVSYIHRIGRTGRAGRRGLSVTFFTEADMDSLRSVANVMRLSGCEVRRLSYRLFFLLLLFRSVDLMVV